MKRFKNPHFWDRLLLLVGLPLLIVLIIWMITVHFIPMKLG